MTIAGRKGKYLNGLPGESQWDRMEDVLTADVFGAYRYLPPDLGILPLLRLARDERFRPLDRFLADRGVDLEALREARFYFWPTLQDGCEPDLLVALGPAASPPTVLLLVEAKLYSSQHTILECSQIGHYLRLHIKGGHADVRLTGPPPLACPLLYLTAHCSLPAKELAQARAEVEDRLPDVNHAAIGLFWASWAMAGAAARDVWRRERAHVGERPWLRALLDLTDDLAARDLMPRPPFQGFIAERPTQFGWTYKRRSAAPPSAVSRFETPYRLRTIVNGPDRLPTRVAHLSHRTMVTTPPWKRLPRWSFQRGRRR